MISQEQLVNVLGPLYESAKEGSAEAWQHAYEQLACLFSSGPGTLSFYSAVNNRFNRIANTFSEDCLRAFDSHYINVSPIQTNIVKTPVGKTFWRVKDCDDGRFINTEFYRDFARKEDVYDILNVKLWHQTDIDAVIGFTRPKTLPFTHHDLAAMGFLIPHLQSAFHIFLTLCDAHIQKGRMEEVVSTSPRGIILLNRSAKIVYCNEAAENILASKDGLEIDRNGCLLARQSQDTRKLKIALESVFNPDMNGDATQGGFLLVSRPSGQRSLQLHISPLSRQNFAGYSPENIALVFVFNPEQRFETVEGLLRQMYGLTSAEARLAGMLAKGISLKEAEDMLDVKSSTIHTHMKHIFSKMDCKRQGELITIIFNGLAALKNLDRTVKK